MQRLGRAAAALLQAHRSLLAAGAVQQQQQQQHATAAVVQRFASRDVSSSWSQQQAAHHSLTSSSQQRFQSSHLSSCGSIGGGLGQLAALPQLFSCRPFATSASCSDSSSSSSSSQPSPTAAVPAAPAVQQPTQPQQQQQRGPIEGICRRKNIKLGWKKIDFVLRMVRRSFVDDALAQLAANPKKSAVFALHAIANARNNAICAGADPAKLWVAQAYVTKGRYRKYMAIMGRGNTGIKETRYSHLNVKVKQLEEGNRSVPKAMLRRRPIHVAPLVQRLQQGRRGRAVGRQVQQQQQWRRRQQ